MAKIKRVKNVTKKIKITPHHGFLEGVAVYYGFDKPTITMSFIDGISGLPVKGLTKSNFTAAAVQAPSGWALNKKLNVSSTISNADGVYTFTLSDKGKDLQKGRWTVVIKAIKITGQTSVNGQTLLHFFMP